MLLLMLLLVFALIAGSSGCTQQRDTDDEEHAQKPSAAEQLPPGVVRLTKAQQAAIQLQTAPVSTANVPEVLPIASTVEAPAGEEVQVVAPVQGYIEAPAAGLPHVGMHVRGGELLAVVQQAYSGSERVQLQVNRDAARATADAAEAQLKTAEAQLGRSQRLYRDKIAPLKQVQQDEAAVVKARADRDSALAQAHEYEAALSNRSNGASSSSPSRYELRAPISGNVSAAQVTPGQMTDPSRPLFSIVNAAVVWVRVPVPENEIASTSGMSAAFLTVAAYPNARFPLHRVGSTGVVDPATHTLTLIFAADNRNGELKPGMAATVLLQRARRIPALVVPASAVVQDPAGTVVFVAMGAETFRRQPVTVQYTGAAATAAIASGVNAGDRVVTRGGALLESELQRGSIQEED